MDKRSRLNEIIVLRDIQDQNFIDELKELCHDYEIIYSREYEEPLKIGSYVIVVASPTNPKPLYLNNMTTIIDRLDDGFQLKFQDVVHTYYRENLRQL